MKGRAFWLTILAAWIVFVGIDFLFHASLFEALWKEEIAVIKPARELFVLIPAGYLSFFLLTLLVGWMFVRIFPGPAGKKDAVEFALVFGGLYTAGNALALFSYVDIPPIQLAAFHAVYLIEICAVVYIFYRSGLMEKKGKLLRYAGLFFLAMLAAGIVIQNI
jgi:hypothetical protein